MDKRLTPVQETILACASRYQARLSRSALAKLLVGSQSNRIAGLNHGHDYGRLADHGRKAVTFEIDILLQQGYLALAHDQTVIPGPHFPTDLE